MGLFHDMIYIYIILVLGVLTVKGHNCRDPVLKSPHFWGDAPCCNTGAHGAPFYRLEQHLGVTNLKQMG